MSGISTKWPVQQEHAVQDGDVDDTGAVRDECIGRWVAAAVSAYVDGCPRLQELAAEDTSELTQTPVVAPAGAAIGRPASVYVTAGATELHPTSFTVAVRIRPMNGDHDEPANATCVVRVNDMETGEARPLDDDIRDELIAIQHAARYSN
jgi:acyl-CoA thioesterase FadM